MGIGYRSASAPSDPYATFRVAGHLPPWGRMIRAVFERASRECSPVGGATALPCTGPDAACRVGAEAAAQVDHHKRSSRPPDPEHRLRVRRKPQRNPAASDQRWLPRVKKSHQVPMLAPHESHTCFRRGNDIVRWPGACIRISRVGLRHGVPTHSRPRILGQFRRSPLRRQDARGHRHHVTQDDADRGRGRWHRRLDG